MGGEESENSYKYFINLLSSSNYLVSKKLKKRVQILVWTLNIILRALLMN
jgi:hypothetical protein